MLAILPAAVIFLSQAEPHPFLTTLQGAWVDYLEYPKGDKRTRLATMLRVTTLGDGRSAAMRFVYDEGPLSIMEDKHTVHLDPAAKTYRVSYESKDTTYRISGLDSFAPGKTGTAILSGRSGTTDVRLTLTVRPNSLTMLRETRAPGEDFVFGSVFHFTRVE